MARTSLHPRHRTCLAVFPVIFTILALLVACANFICTLLVVVALPMTMLRVSQTFGKESPNFLLKWILTSVLTLYAVFQSFTVGYREIYIIENMLLVSLLLFAFWGMIRSKRNPVFLQKKSSKRRFAHAEEGTAYGSMFRVDSYGSAVGTAPVEDNVMLFQMDKKDSEANIPSLLSPARAASPQSRVVQGQTSAGTPMTPAIPTPASDLSYGSGISESPEMSPMSSTASLRDMIDNSASSMHPSSTSLHDRLFIETYRRRWPTKPSDQEAVDLDESTAGPVDLAGGQARSLSWIDSRIQDWKLITCCEQCHVSKPPRCHHCTRCNGCVLIHDHHSTWLNVCVGSHNHRQFLFTTLMLFLAGCYGAQLTFTTVCTPVIYLDWFLVPNDCRFIYTDIMATVVWVSGLYTASLLVLLGYVLAEQILLVSQNITTHEMRVARQHSMVWMGVLALNNVNNKGFLTNWLVFLEGRRSLSYGDVMI